MMNLKYAVASVALLAVGGAAQAALETPESANGELVLSVWDPVAKVSYARELNVRLNDYFAPGGASSIGALAPQTFAGDDLFKTTFAGSTADNIVWNLGASDNQGPTAVGRFITTGKLGLDPSTLPVTKQGVQQAADHQLTWFFKLAQAGIEATGSISAVEGQAHYAGDGLNWGANWNGGFSTGSTGTINEDLGFYFFEAKAGGLGFQAADVKGVYGNTSGASFWSLDLATGDLTAQSPGGAPVPVPAAVWLLGSGLFGLVSVARRRRG